MYLGSNFQRSFFCMCWRPVFLPIKMGCIGQSFFAESYFCVCVSLNENLDFFFFLSISQIFWNKSRFSGYSLSKKRVLCFICWLGSVSLEHLRSAGHRDVRGDDWQRCDKAPINTVNSFVPFSRKLLEECCDPGQLFAMTKMNSPMGKNLWFDGEFLYSVTIDNATYSLFPQVSNNVLF